MVSPRALEPEQIQSFVKKYASGGRAQLLPALWEAQKIWGYISEPVAAAIGKTLRVPLAEVHGVLEFYTMLYNRPVGRTLVRVCISPMCTQRGGRDLLQKARDFLGVNEGETTADGAFTLETVECLGLCAHAPAALVGETPVSTAVNTDPRAWIISPQPVSLGRVGGEPRWLTARVGQIEPTDLRAFEQRGGFAALRKALGEMPPQRVIAEIEASGLSGRGGAAFPTGLKWKFTAGAEGEPKYVVCNADESEPGTFKDRVLLEGDPFAVLEGMALAGYAIGAHKGYLYVRGEYPRAQATLQAAIEKARAAGYLGRDILGSGFDFDVELRSGAGAYICGEETALFESIEGKRGFPRLKPPFPTTHGLFNKPTVINNVETLCAAVWIIANGVDAYRSVGTSDSPGSKLFCLSGDVAQPGVYEAPFGITLGELIEMTGGAQGEIQAVLLGGAAGAFAGPEQMELPMSFEGLRAAGLPLGSGVVNVINTDRDLKRILLSLAHFFAHESCGKCFPCQLGTQRQLELVEKIAFGEATSDDLAALEDLGFAMTQASLCGLGQTAASAILSALNRWPEIV